VAARANEKAWLKCALHGYALLCSNGRVQSDKVNGERIHLPLRLHTGIRGRRIRNVGDCVKVVLGRPIKTLDLGPNPKKSLAVASQAKKFGRGCLKGLFYMRRTHLLCKCEMKNYACNFNIYAILRRRAGLHEAKRALRACPAWARG
jgi:hypothetical protein